MSRLVKLLEKAFGEDIDTFKEVEIRNRITKYISNDIYSDVDNSNLENLSKMLRKRIG